MKKLSSLKQGECAVVREIKLQHAIQLRFNELGITKGAKITMIKKAPFGDPVEYDLRGYRLCLRNSEADQIIVTTEA